MAEITDFGLLVLLVAAMVALAVFSHKLSERVPIPSPAIFLLAAATIVHFWPRVGRQLSILDVERVAVVALIVILFDGGMRVGWRRFREAAVPISLLGVAGTLATAALVALAGRYVFEFSWTGAWILGAALAPTDPAVMFSVLGKREVGGRTGTILEGESGVNDPVGIALMLGMLEYAGHADATFWVVVEEFAIEMAVGLAVGVAGAWLVLRSLRTIHLANPALYPLRSLAAAGVIYGVAAVAHGSGFLAVFAAGVLIGDADYPRRGDVERFHTSLASLAEIVVFVALGLSVNKVNLEPVWTDGILIALLLAFVVRPLAIAPMLAPEYPRRGDVERFHTSLASLAEIVVFVALGLSVNKVNLEPVWTDGVLIALLLAFVVRPLAIAPMLAPLRLRRGERVFVMWSGLKGAVPILLAAFALLADVGGADRIYAIVFVVVAFSVIFQGASVPFAARRLGIPMRVVHQGES